MKYRVTGIYKHETEVDTKSRGYVQWRKSWRGKDFSSERYAVVRYAQDMLNYSIIDDDGHGVLTADSLEWEAGRKIE